MTFKLSSVALPDLYEASIVELQDGLVKGHFTSVQLVKAYFNRIEEVNLKGPVLHAVIETNSMALSQAAALDDERKDKGSRGPFHGIPLLLKDNIATLHEEGMNTTAGIFCAATYHSVDVSFWVYHRFLRTARFCRSSRRICCRKIT
jgi:amidase